MPTLILLVLSSLSDIFYAMHLHGWWQGAEMQYVKWYGLCSRHQHPPESLLKPWIWNHALLKVHPSPGGKHDVSTLPLILAPSKLGYESCWKQSTAQVEIEYTLFWRGRNLTRRLWAEDIYTHGGVKYLCLCQWCCFCKFGWHYCMDYIFSFN